MKYDRNVRVEVEKKNKNTKQKDVIIDYLDI